jgi:hypothetical protein
MWISDRFSGTNLVNPLQHIPRDFLRKTIYSETPGRKVSFREGKMKNRILALAAVTLFSLVALGQATPISSAPEQRPAPATQEKGAKHSRKARIHHTKGHHRSHRKHHKVA